MRKVALMMFVFILQGVLGPLRAEQPSSGATGTIVTVGDRAITRAMVDRQVEMMTMFLPERKPGLSAEKQASFRKQQLKPLSDRLFQQTVIDLALAPSNVVPDAVAVKTIHEEVAKKFGKRGQTFEEVRALALQKGFGAEFDKGVGADILFHSYLISAYSNRYFVTSGDLAKSRERIARYNERAIASNRVTVARAKAILSDLDKGVSFAALADKYTEDAQHASGGELGDCDANDFVDNKHVWEAVQMLKATEHTELLSIDDGYAIYRVNKKNPAEHSTTEMPSVNLSRIYFRRPYIYPDKSDEDLYDEVLEDRHEKLFPEVYLALRKTVKIKYN